LNYNSEKKEKEKKCVPSNPIILLNAPNLLHTAAATTVNSKNKANNKITTNATTVAASGAKTPSAVV